MKNKRELRNMADKMLGPDDDGGADNCRQTIAISGENHTIVIYANGPITIQQAPAKKAESDAAPVRGVPIASRG
jgi:hypothetical protein